MRFVCCILLCLLALCGVQCQSDVTLTSTEENETLATSGKEGGVGIQTEAPSRGDVENLTEMLTESPASSDSIAMMTELTDSEATENMATPRPESGRQIRRGWKYRGSGYPKPEFSAPPFFSPNFPRPASQDTMAKINSTRVELLSAECYSSYMRIDVRFNGSFQGLIYSTGYANDADCLYVNGTGAVKYQFVIRLNRCGTLGKQTDHMPYAGAGVPGETTTVERQQEFLWNSITVQYNPIIEEENDEQLRVTCEYGSDVWKTVTFPVINVRVSTGSPMSFTLSPPQCQMEILQGYGTAGLRIGGPVVVGDPLTLTIQMKSISAGFDIVVSNCVAHNGGQMRLQLIDVNGCVLNDKLMSRFRGYNHLGDYGEEVTLYSYVKAFRFTGSPALYLECDVRMCRSTCPPQRCYWRSLSKRSLGAATNESLHHSREGAGGGNRPVLSESVSLVQALEVRHESSQDVRPELQTAVLSTPSPQVCMRTAAFGSLIVLMTLVTLTSTVLSCCLHRRLNAPHKPRIVPA